MSQTDVRPDLQGNSAAATPTTPSTTPSTTAIAVSERPTHAPNIEFLGEAQGSSFEAQFWLVQHEGRFVQLTSLLYRIVQLADGHTTLAEIAGTISSEIGRGVSAENIRYLIENRLLKLGLIQPVDDDSPSSEAAESSRSPLRLMLRKKVISPRIIAPVTGLLQFLFHPVALLPLVALIVASQWWLYAMHGVAPAIAQILRQPELIVPLSALIVASAVFHEFGHASALRYGGGTARTIGVGLYFIYPAFYTDVTDGYRLGRWARVRTDLGGFYFNLIFSLGVLLLYQATHQEYLLLFVLLTDLDILEEFSPFLRFDGYWVLADLTGVPDFLSMMMPFLRSILPVPWLQGPKLPPLKRWARAMFAVYALVTVPILTLLFYSMFVSAPFILGLAWQSLLTQLAAWPQALERHQIAELALLAVRIGILCLPVAAFLLSLYFIVQRLVKVLWRFGTKNRSHALATSIVTAALLVWLAFMWHGALSSLVSLTAPSATPAAAPTATPHSAGHSGVSTHVAAPSAMVPVAQPTQTSMPTTTPHSATPGTTSTAAPTASPVAQASQTQTQSHTQTQTQTRTQTQSPVPVHAQTSRAAQPAAASVAPATQPIYPPISITCAYGTHGAAARVCIHTAPGAELAVTNTYTCNSTTATSALSIATSGTADGNGNFTWSWQAAACPSLVTVHVTSTAGTSRSYFTYYFHLR